MSAPAVCVHCGKLIDKAPGARFWVHLGAGVANPRHPATPARAAR